MGLTFDESKVRWGSRCCECGKHFADSDVKREVALGHAMHESCFERAIEKCVLGSGEQDEATVSVTDERRAFLERTTPELKLAYERTSALFGQEIAEKVRKLVWGRKDTNPKRFA